MFAAAEAKAAGYGGIAAASRATGIAVSTIDRALRELADGSEPVPGQIRRPGGGRKPLVESDTGLMEALLALVEPQQRLQQSSQPPFRLSQIPAVIPMALNSDS